jgi:secretion/DNA translocation related TadE-like protein
VRASDRGTGSVITIALVAAIVALTALVVPLYRGFALRASVAGAADAAALAAADVAVGLVPGYPCEIAAEVANANGAGLASCEVDGLVVTVVAARSLLGIPVTAAATAGPSPGEAD